MKKLLLVLAVAAFAQTMNAQTVLESKNADNWYIGINGGVTAPSNHYKVLKNINFDGGIRFGRWFTPSLGLAIDAQAYFGSNYANTYNTSFKFDDLKTFVKMTNIGFLGTVNFSNWFGGYPGTPRGFEVIGLAGLGWMHYYGGMKHLANAMSSKLGVDLAFNFGFDKQWQFYVEPNIVYHLTDDLARMQYNLSRSNIGVNVGLNYKFMNSNGTHNFKIAELRDQNEIDFLNAKINELRSDVNAKDSKIAADAKTIAELQAKLRECESRPPVVEQKETFLQPVVIFRQSKSVIDATQYASIEMIAKYMLNHPESKVTVRGYASTEGNANLNQKLSEKRAAAVKNALVKKYKIDADRIFAEGLGATDQISDERGFNRVAMFIENEK